MACWTAPGRGRPPPLAKLPAGAAKALETGVGCWRGGRLTVAEVAATCLQPETSII
jgi:hypothetical protein